MCQFYVCFFIQPVLFPSIHCEVDGWVKHCDGASCQILTEHLFQDVHMFWHEVKMCCFVETTAEVHRLTR